ARRGGVRRRDPPHRRVVHCRDRVDRGDPGARVPAGDRRMTRRRTRWIALALVAGAVLALRAPSLTIPILNEDEALYATTAASMAEGQPPYRAGVESKPPGIFYLYQAAVAVVGRYDMKALHGLTMLWVLGTALLVGAIARRAAGRPQKPPEAGADPPDRVLSVSTVAALLYVAFTIVEEPAVMA